MSNSTVAQCLESKERTEDVIINENVSFESLLLSQKLLNGLKKAGFKKPSPIQLKAIPVGRCGFDLIVKSKSGTGKTLVFSVVALEMVQATNSDVQVLILVPVREIAVQIQDVLTSVGCFIEGLKIELFIGGLPTEGDKEKCKLCHIAVGTPGRVKHLITQGILETNSIRLFILDEADKLMEQSFQSDINEIYNHLPERKQMITTSATYPNDLNDFLGNYMLSPTHITVELLSPVLLGLRQFVRVIDHHANVVQQMQVKNEHLLKILTNTAFTQCLIFSNYQTRAESISNILNQKGWNSTFISAAQTQTQRLQALNNLKEFKCRILLSTDLTARGIDANNVDLVINYDIPTDPMTYLHRMGRAGRYGSYGICINLAFEGKELHQLQKLLGETAGPRFRVPILPDLEGKALDLVTISSSSFKHVISVMPEASEPKHDIKSEVMELKASKRKKKASKVVLESNKDELNIGSILATSKNEEKELAEKFSSMDAKSLLETLASGGLVMESSETSKSEPDPLILQQLTFADDYKKRKRTEKDSHGPSSSESVTSDQNREKQKPKTSVDIFYKNRALLSVSKLLINADATNKEDVDSIGQYLQLLKEEDRDTSQEIPDNASDILQNIDKYLNPTKTETQPLKTKQNIKTRSNTIENIFQIGYDYATKADAKHWMDCLPESELQKFEELKLVDEETCDDDNVDEDYEDFDMEQFQEVEHVEEGPAEMVNSESDHSYDFMKWVPVVKKKTVQKQVQEQQTYMLQQQEDNSASFDHLNSYFEECSDNLWQNGMSFDNVPAFDDYFYYEWQAQVYSVRNYIQQNVYVQEMSKYQQLNSKSDINK